MTPTSRRIRGQQIATQVPIKDDAANWLPVRTMLEAVAVSDELIARAIEIAKKKR